MRRSLLAIVFAVFATLLLSACSGIRVVGSDVSAFSSWSAAPPAPGTPYRFERLPSQQSANLQQDRIEALAQSSLAKVGMQLDPERARFSVQVVLNRQALLRYPDGGLGWGGPGVFMGAGNAGASFGVGIPMGMGMGQPYYTLEVTLLMRELATQKLVFETRALNDGPWGDSLAIVPAMLDAALQGFPQPPAGTRRINVEIPR